MKRILAYLCCALFGFALLVTRPAEVFAFSPIVEYDLAFTGTTVGGPTSGPGTGSSGGGFTGTTVGGPTGGPGSGGGSGTGGPGTGGPGTGGPGSGGGSGTGGPGGGGPGTGGPGGGGSGTGGPGGGGGPGAGGSGGSGHGGGTPDWSYGGENNPTRWGSLSGDFALCSQGGFQSPININAVSYSSPAQIEFNYSPTPLIVKNNGHSIEVKYRGRNTVRISGERYRLRQLHFHTPSEHQIEGEASAMEMHLVHRNAAKELAVVSVLIEEGAFNPTIDRIWSHIPAKGRRKKVPDLTINAADLLPYGQSYYSYRGSLTTPPCSEGVSWIVMTEPIEVSKEQIDAFEKLYPVNARPIQATNRRRVELHPG